MFKQGRGGCYLRPRTFSLSFISGNYLPFIKRLVVREFVNRDCVQTIARLTFVPSESRIRCRRCYFPNTIPTGISVAGGRSPISHRRLRRSGSIAWNTESRVLLCSIIWYRSGYGRLSEGVRGGVACSGMEDAKLMTEYPWYCSRTSCPVH